MDESQADIWGTPLGCAGAQQQTHLNLENALRGIFWSPSTRIVLVQSLQKNEALAVD
jgi:hypothetical protein